MQYFGDKATFLINGTDNLWDWIKSNSYYAIIDKIIANLLERPIKKLSWLSYSYGAAG